MVCKWYELVSEPVVLYKGSEGYIARSSGAKLQFL